MIITLCASASHYQEIFDVQKELEQKGHVVLVPVAAEHMRERGNFDVEKYKTWFTNPQDYAKKQELMRLHFAEILKGDATLVVNMEKRGLRGYIGGNVLMEMAIAFHAGKPIYLLNDIDDALPVKEEVLGMQPIILHGDLFLIPSSHTAPA